MSLIQQITSLLKANEDFQILSSTYGTNGNRLPEWCLSDMDQGKIHSLGSPYDTEADPYVLPPVAEADHLIHVYFSTVHLFLPCLDERLFVDKYKHCQTRVRNSSVAVSGAWLGSFYTVLSLACQCLQATSPERDRARDSEIYYRKALKAGLKDAIYGMGFEVGECS